MKKLLFLLLILSMSASAQTFTEDGYEQLYDADHRIVVRECVACTEHMQDLWNGCHVRIIGAKTWIYREGQQITWGDKVWLELTGDYVVQRGNLQYLIDEDGDQTGLSGSQIETMWNHVFAVKKGQYWYLFRHGGSRIGSVYSDEPIMIYWNRHYCYHTPDGKYRVADREGKPIPQGYSDDPPVLMTDGNFRYKRNGNWYIYDTTGNPVH